jgi:FtsZ-binding cell division protein ZapB
MDIEKIIRNLKITQEGLISDGCEGLGEAIQQSIDFIESQQAEIERLKADKWISVKNEKKPERNEKVIIAERYKEVNIDIDTACFEEGEFYDCQSDELLLNVTHWQSLPGEPKN